MTNLSGANLNNGAAVGPQGEGRDSPSTFPAYPTYKDSGVEWLGVVPEHWGVSPLKWLVEQVTDKATTSDFQVGLENIEGWTGRFIETDTEFAGDGIAFRQEDILFGKLRPYLAKVWLAGKSGQAVGDFFVLRPRAVNSEFLHKYILTPTVIEDLNASTIGAKMPRVGWEDMAALAVTLPPHKEQTQIARFLDHETARIDALIAEQQRLIELLKEKRQAVISHAVTKGLDPTVPMKDSGVEWLGEVPAHWVVSRAKLVSDIFVPQRNKPELNDSEGIPWVTMEDMNGGYISATNLRVTEFAADEAGSKVLKKGAVIASCVGRFGIVAINAVDVVINQQLQAFEPRKIKAEYLRSIVSLSKEYFELIGTAATLVYVNQQGFENLPVLIPSACEQESICLYVDEANARFDALLSQSFESIRLLQERRAALISAAVTGKIDVRSWQPPASIQAHESAVAEAV
jgi:type I restriction enzyme S subunit